MASEELKVTYKVVNQLVGVAPHTLIGIASGTLAYSLVKRMWLSPQ